MGLKKLTADYIFDGYQLLKDTVVLIKKDGIIEGLRGVQEVDPATVETFKGILCPGFINTHCHLELSHLKGMIATGTGLPGFVSQVMRLRHFEKEEILSAIREADQNMWQDGIQAVGDICNTPDTLPQKRTTSIRYRNFVECLGFLPEQADSRFDYSQKQVYEPLHVSNPATTMVPHAPYSVSPALFKKINTFIQKVPATKDRIISIHNQESAPENEFFQKGTGLFCDFYKKMGVDISFYKPSGRTSLQTVLQEMNAARKLLLIHNTFSTREDLSYAKQTGNTNDQSIYFILCPGANLYIESRLPDIKCLMEEEVQIALGTDSLASNHTLSIAHEIQQLLKAYPDINKQMLLQWATLNGARALGFDDDLGSFEKGKCPGILLLSKELDFIQRIC